MDAPQGWGEGTLGSPGVQEGFFPLFSMLVSHLPSAPDGSLGKTSLSPPGWSWASGNLLEVPSTEAVGDSPWNPQCCSKAPVDKIPPVPKVPEDPLLKAGGLEEKGNATNGI